MGQIVTLLTFGSSTRMHTGDLCSCCSWVLKRHPVSVMSAWYLIWGPWGWRNSSVMAAVQQDRVVNALHRDDLGEMHSRITSTYRSMHAVHTARYDPGACGRNCGHFTLKTEGMHIGPLVPLQSTSTTSCHVCWPEHASRYQPSTT